MADVEREMCEVTGHLNAQHARLVDLTIWLLANEREWSGPGVWRAEQYLAWRAGVAPHRAAQLVEIARRAEELPECVEAFRRGELSVDQMAAIAKRAPWWTDAEICELGKMMTVRQLRDLLAKYPFEDYPKPGEAAVDESEQATGSEGDTDTDTDGATGAPGGDGEPEPEVEIGADPVLGCGDSTDRCTFHFDDDGTFHLHLQTDKVTGDLIDQALTEARDGLFHDGQKDVSWTDALRNVCERSLDGVKQPSRRNRYRINYHLDVTGGAVDARGWRLPDMIRRHVTCDGLLSPVFVESGRPVSVGRSQHVVPDRTRRLVELRDQGCRVPGCTQTRWLDVHHIIHWLDLGPTETWNLICLCPHHHRLHHRGKLGISGNADEPGGVTFTNEAGNPIAQSGARPEPPGAPPSPPIGTYEHPLGERMDGRWLYFSPPPEYREVVTPKRMADDHWGQRPAWS